MRNIIEQEGNNGQQIFTARVEWVGKANDQHARDRAILGKELPLSLDIAIHPANTGRIIVNFPGYNGEIDGYGGKYKRLAVYMQEQGLGAVVRSANKPTPGFTIDTHLRAMLGYALENAREICDTETPELYLMGFSAGASAIAAVARDYPQVKRVLLGAPSGNAGRDIENLRDFTGEVYILVGKDDEVVGEKAGPLFYGLATSASHRELFTLPHCDHRFTGETNGRIVSQAPFYAFAVGEKPMFPLEDGGIVLYK